MLVGCLSTWFQPLRILLGVDWLCQTSLGHRTSSRNVFGYTEVSLVFRFGARIFAPIFLNLQVEVVLVAVTHAPTLEPSTLDV